MSPSLTWRRRPALPVAAVALGAALTLTATLSTTPSITPHLTPTASGAHNPLAGASFYVDPTSVAAYAERDLRPDHPRKADWVHRIAGHPLARWLGDWYDAARAKELAGTTVTDARKKGEVPVFVIYAIPHRDCSGGYSSGGMKNARAYKRYVGHVARGIHGRRAVVLLEPDALPDLTCLAKSARDNRVRMIRHAAERLTQSRRTVLYLDAGHSHWQDVSTMVHRLRRAGVGMARGFSLNVGNFYRTGGQERYGDHLGKRLGKHYVIDTSRNGRGPAPTWCNPTDEGLGTRPTSRTNGHRADAYLWVKNPGESDGECNGGPSAGTWWTDYAIGMAKRAAW